MPSMVTYSKADGAGEAVDPNRLTQVGQALRELGIRMIPAYSPQGVRSRGTCFLPVLP